MAVATDVLADRMTFAEVGEALGRKPKTIGKWSRTGMHDFPKPVHLGQTPYILRSEFAAWLESRKRHR